MEVDQMTVEKISHLTGLSPYMLRALYDFHAHTLSRGEMVKKRPILTTVFCGNVDIPCAGSDAEIKALVMRRDAELKAQGVSGKEKDFRLVNEFTGWAQTREGHFIYVYFVGTCGGGGSTAGNNDTASNRDDKKATEKKERQMRRVENWRPVCKDHLALYHTRLGRDTSSHMSMSSLDIVETDDGNHNLSLDVRFLVKRWFKSNEVEHGDLLREALCLYAGGAGTTYLRSLCEYRSLKNCDETVYIHKTKASARETKNYDVEELIEGVI